jgi:hypothetical protein
MESIVEIPNEESLKMTGPGRLGVFHCLSLIMRIYAEQKFSTPSAAQSNWWKGGSDMRKEMLARIKSQVGSEGAANCILNCYDILYRKFIREILTNGSKDSKDKLDKLANAFSKRLFNSGSALFQNLLRVETKTRQVKMETVKGKKTVTETVEQKYRARVRPHVTDGPKTAFESTMYAKVNSALAKIEGEASDYSLDSKKFSSPKEWEEKHDAWVKSLYQKVRTPSHMIVRRKNAIRANILAEKAKNPAQNTGTSATGNQASDRITPEKWIAAQDSYFKENEEAADKASIKALNDMLETSYKREELLDLTEERIIAIFSKC